MEIAPILRTFCRNKVRIALIALEVALTLAIVVNCLNMVLDLRGKLTRPTGIDEENIVTVVSQPFDAKFKDEDYLKTTVKTDLDLLRTLPGVVAAEATQTFPLSGAGSASGYKPLNAKTDLVSTGVFYAGPDMVKVLGVKIIQGRDLQESDVNESEARNVVITKQYADVVFPDGKAVGRQLQQREAKDPETIVGVIEHMHGSWPGWDHVGRVMIYPDRRADFNWGSHYMVRTRPGQMAALLKALEPALLKADSGRNITIKKLTELKASVYSENVAMTKMLSAVVILLIFVTALGIVGITSFSVAERTRQIGTRRALGAKRFEIARYFLIENWLICTAGLVAGTAMTYGLNYLLVQWTEAAILQHWLVLTGLLCLWTVSLLAALAPALRAARVPPALATRTI